MSPDQTMFLVAIPFVVIVGLLLLSQHEYQASATEGERETEATATNRNLDLVLEESSDESDGEWKPGQTFEDFLYPIPLDEARVMAQAGHAAQQKRIRF